MGDCQKEKGVGVEVVNMHLDMLGELDGVNVSTPGFGAIILPAVEYIKRRSKEFFELIKLVVTNSNVWATQKSHRVDRLLGEF